MSSSNGTGKTYTRGKLVRMPSGMEATLRGVGFDTLLLTDRVPDFLTPYVVEIVNGNGDAKPPVPENSPETTKEYLKFLNLITELAFVEPRIVDNPQHEGEIAVDDVHQIDKEFILRKVLGQATHWLVDFRPEQNQNVDAVAVESNLPAQTEPTGETEATPAP